MGTGVGRLMGTRVGIADGASVTKTVGTLVGACEGCDEGRMLGECVGWGVGFIEGCDVGRTVGKCVGDAVGDGVKCTATKERVSAPLRAKVDNSAPQVQVTARAE